MAGVLYIRPAGATESCSHCGQDHPPQWSVFDDPDGDAVAGPFDTRAEAKQAALNHRIDESVVLLRADGSVHSEMRAAGEPNKRTKALARSGISVDGGSASDGGS